MKNVLTPLAKSILVPLGLTAAASAQQQMQLFKRKFLDEEDCPDNLEKRNGRRYKNS